MSSIQQENSSSHSAFRFKHFEVRHDLAIHKVGTDAVLLGAWARTEDAQDVLDIGTGSGVIALMLAQRTKASARIVAIEPDQSSFRQAADNFLRSPWPGKIQAVNIALQEFHPGIQFDLIVSNPPYFNRSLEPPALSRRDVRHTSSLSHQDLLKGSQKLLKPSGRFCVILPTTEGDQFQEQAFAYGLFCQQRLVFFSRENKPQERWLLEFSKDPGNTVTQRLTLYDGPDHWSENYRVLTEDFYLDRP